MIEHQKLNFETSYILDMLCFLDLLYSEKSNKEVELIREFEESLSDTSRKYMWDIHRQLPRNESITSIIVPMVTADPEFNSLRFSELLGSPKYLILTFKKTDFFKQAPKVYKKFINRSSEKVIRQLSLVIEELEKDKFKSFWLEKRLPLINQKIKEYNKEILPFKPIETFNTWLQPVVIHERTCYVLSFYEGDSMSILSEDLMISIDLSALQVLKSIIKEVFNKMSICSQLKLMKKELKTNLELRQLYKEVKNEYPSLIDYLDENMKLALIVYFYHHFEMLDYPYQYLNRYNFGTHKLSVLFYDYMVKSPKGSRQTLTDYLVKVIHEIEWSRLDQKLTMIIHQETMGRV